MAAAGVVAGKGEVKQERMIAMDARYWVVTDLETGGLDPDRHDIVQIARVVVDAAAKRVLSGSEVVTYVRPVKWDNSSQEAKDIHGISLETAMGGLPLSEALGMWCRNINWEESIVAAWGIDFELKFLHRAFGATERVVPFNYRNMDIRSLAHGVRAARGGMTYLSLKDACADRGILFDKNKAHDALYDAQRTAELAMQLLTDLDPVINPLVSWGGP